MITKLSDAPDGKERITKGLEGFEKKGIIAFLSECPIRADQRPAQPAVQPVEHPLEVEEPFEQAQVRRACSAAGTVGVWSGGVRGQPGSSPVGRWGVGGAGCACLPPPPSQSPHPPTHAHTQLDLVDLGAAGTQNTATCLCSRMSTPATAGCGRCLSRMPSSLPATSVPANGKPVGAAAPELGTRVWYCDGY